MSHTFTKVLIQIYAKEVTVNAKMRRPGICGATETILIDFEVLESHLPMIIFITEKGMSYKGDKDVIAKIIQLT